MINHFDPEDWELSTLRCIKEWVETEIAYPELYEVIMEFPGTLLDEQNVPLSKAIIHFEVDDVRSAVIGFGEGDLAQNYDPVTKSVNPQYAARHTLNFDVGVWTSDRSGGTTSRALLRQELQQLFGPGGMQKFMEAVDAGDGTISVVNFTGGRNTTDRVNDVPVYRTVNGELEVRVFSRTKLRDAPGPAIDEIDQSPNLTIIG